MNMDYAICQAIKYFKDVTSVLVIYDICCQWLIRFFQRVASSTTLSLPEKLSVIGAIGKFHLGAHIKDCFHKFSLNFIQYSGQVDGEIMETNWASLNEISGLTRAMTKAHRQEVLDDYMNDLNWKKLTGSGEFDILNRSHSAELREVQSLVRKWKNAENMFSKTKLAYEALTPRLRAEWTKEWLAEEDRAMRERGGSLCIYEVDVMKGMDCSNGIGNLPV